MSAREWKPGDLALVKWTDSGSESVAIVESARADEEVLSVWTYTGDVRGPLAFNKRDLRPLVVIDPENNEHLDRLVALKYYGHLLDRTMVHTVLLEIANPQPPKPDEPTGLGAVVEDAEGDFWVYVGNRTALSDTRIWQHARKELVFDEIAAVKVLSKGVQS